MHSRLIIILLQVKQQDIVAAFLAVLDKQPDEEEVTDGFEVPLPAGGAESIEAAVTVANRTKTLHNKTKKIRFVAENSSMN